MTCESCTRATVGDPYADDFAPGCQSCLGRALAVTGADIEDDVFKDRYIGALDKLFGSKRKDGSKIVSDWRAKLKQYKAAP